MVGQVSHSFSATQAEITGTQWVGPNEWNSLHSLNVTLTGNTAGSSSLSGTNIILGATQNITASASTAATGTTLWLEGPQLSAWQIGEGTTTTYDATSLGASSASIFGGLFIIPTELAAQRIDLFGTISVSGPTFTSSSTSHTSTTTGNTTINLGLWSRQGGTSTGTLSLMSSAQMILQYSLSQSGTSSSQSDTMSLTWSTGIPQASVTATMSGTSNSTSATALTSGSARWTGAFDLPLAFSSTYPAGEYFLGLQIVTAGSSVPGPRMSFSFAKLVGSFSMNYLGSTNTLSNPPSLEYMQGLAMTNGSSNAMPSAYTMSNLSPTGLGQPLAQMVNYGTNASLL